MEEELYFYQVFDDDVTPRRIFYSEDHVARAVETHGPEAFHVFASSVEVVPFTILAAGVLYRVGVNTEELI